MTVAACGDCLRRVDLIAALAGRIEIEWRGRKGRPALLALEDDDLLEWGADAAVRRRYRGFDADRARARIELAELSAVCRCEEVYPAALRDLGDPPAVVHLLGALPVAEAVAIVGARKRTAQGGEVARSLGRALAASGMPVVSGMALGIDSDAHLGALAGGGPTVAVLAGGADRVYPARHVQLHSRIAANGAVVSEMPPGHGPFRWAFPARNRLIAALSSATVVVEAAERSGSLITADLAAELGRPVGAVPGPVTSPMSRGTNLLIKTGAEVIRDAQDVLDLVFGAGERTLAATPHDLPAEHRALLDAVRRGRTSLSELTRGREPLAVATALAQLELRGLLIRTFDGRYVPSAA